MAVTMVTLTVQAFIEHEEWDDQDECKDFEEQLSTTVKELENYGTVDVSSVEPFDE